VDLSRYSDKFPAFTHKFIYLFILECWCMCRL